MRKPIAILLSLLVSISSAYPSKYLLTTERIGTLIKKWNRDVEEISGIIFGVSYFFDHKGKRISHELVGYNIFKCAKNRYLDSRNDPSPEGFIAYLTASTPLPDNSPAMAIIEERRRSIVTCHTSLTFRLEEDDIRANLRMFCHFLSEIYSNYMTIGELANRQTPCPLHILIEIVNETVTITTHYL